jgi:hypothetical protein
MADNKVWAFFYRDGVIGSGEAVPGGGLPLAEVTREELEEICSAKCTLCWDNVTWKIPGLATVDNEDDALEIAQDFKDAFDEALADLRGEVRKCRVCGCTQVKGCPGGCYWIAWNLCSACRDKAA